MNSLRNRIAILLILAIVTVVTLATLAASTALRPPLPQTTMEPVARQLHLVIKMIEADPADAVTAGARLQQGPATGAPEDILSGLLVKALSQTGRSRTAIITRNEGRPGITASIKLE
jgi:hypothetical protein